MKVLHVSPSYARKDGGPSEVLRQLIPELRARGLIVELLTTDKGETTADLADRSSLHARVAHAMRFPPKLNFATRYIPELREMVDWSDVVHVHSVSTYVTSVAVAASNRAGRPVVLQPHGALTDYQRSHASRLRRVYDLSVDRTMLARVTGVVVSSELEALQLPRTTGKILNLPLGVAPELFAQRRNAEVDRPFILFLGRVSAKKRLDLVLEALRQPSLQGTRLKIAGPLSADLNWVPAERIAALGLSDRVDMLGEVTAPVRQQLLASATAFVLPSDDESFGVAVAEAMAAGCPVAISANVGLASTYDGPLLQTPFLVTSQNPREIAQRIGQIANDLKLREEMSQRARAHALLHFNWSSAARNLAEFYRAL